MRHLLLYQPRCDQASQLLLPALDNVRLTHAGHAIDALNWLTASRLGIVAFDLVVVAALINEAQEFLFLSELCSVSLPAIFIQQRQEPVPLKIQKKVIVCRPENLIACIDNCV